MKAGIGVAALALLAACGGSESESGLTADEEAKLNEAAAMLDETPDELGAGETNTAGNRQ